MFLLVSGAAASGKSALVKLLRTRLPDVECHDGDEKATPDEYTRCTNLEEWVQQALQVQRQERDFLVASHSPLGELLACPSAPQLAGIAACLLDCSDPVRVARMRARGIDPRWPPDQDTLNWAAWHRMHAWDPQWEPHVIWHNGPAAHRYDRWGRWQQGDPRWQVEMLDTTKFTVEQAADALVEWIDRARALPSPLGNEMRWWGDYDDSLHLT